MAQRGVVRIIITLVVGLLPALIIGGYLVARSGPRATITPSPSPPAVAVAPVATSLPTPTATRAPLPTPTPSSSPTPTIAPLVARPSPAQAPTATTIPATATPAGPAWVEVGHWRDSQLIVTAEFTVPGPWRIRWHLASAAEPFTVMIEQGTATPILLFGPNGATDGVLDEPQGGTYSLMLHNTVAYDVVVEVLRPPASPGATPPA